MMQVIVLNRRNIEPQRLSPKQRPMECAVIQKPSAGIQKPENLRLVRHARA